ncbi:MAG: L,D-transpeptidase [Solirubrobacteraceae bacterium]|jgi:lipoprotein-anchoring transpeptidase ErfK/SrfK
MPSRRTGGILLACLLALATAGSAQAASTSGATGSSGATGATGSTGATATAGTQPGPVPGPTERLAYLAYVVIPTEARTAPSVYASVAEHVGTQSLWVGGPVQLLVLGSAIDAAGREWLQVRLPIRPNDASGWIPSNNVILKRTEWRLVVYLHHRRLEALHDGQLVRSFQVVIGKRATPTPMGLFALYAIARQPPGSELGPYALHLTAHSDVLTNYGGGPGRVAIHGRAGPLLADPIGSARSHGCIRADNNEILWLVARLPLGTPVEVVY